MVSGDHSNLHPNPALMARLAVVGSEACDECAFARPAVRTLIIGESGESLLLPSTRPRVVGDNGAAGIAGVS